MQRMVECKYYLSINNVIDRSTCYETTSESNLKTILIVAQKTLNLWNEKAEQESEYPRYFKICKVEL